MSLSTVLIIGALLNIFILNTFILSQKDEKKNRRKIQREIQRKFDKRA